mmetsp:Transcript_125995/g.245744  ORF Transcript_125995/g.245744 Transcript_125995/m.245744 type:complete len:260 (+) Transcript_125995:595-1374(+)
MPSGMTLVAPVPSMLLEYPPNCEACVFTRRAVFAVTFSGTPSFGPSKSWHWTCTAPPKVNMQLTTAPRSFSSKRSTVPNIADSGTPQSRATFMNMVMFSICLKGKELVPTFLITPGRIPLARAHSTCPLLSQSAKLASFCFKPVIASIHSTTSSTKLMSILLAFFSWASLSIPKKLDASCFLFCSSAAAEPLSCRPRKRLGFLTKSLFSGFLESSMRAFICCIFSLPCLVLFILTISGPESSDSLRSTLSMLASCPPAC